MMLFGCAAASDGCARSAASRTLNWFFTRYFLVDNNYAVDDEDFIECLQPVFSACHASLLSQKKHTVHA